MKATIDRIEAGKLLPADQLARLGLSPRRIVKVTLETVDVDAGEDAPSITQINARGGAFDHLADEPDIYGDGDLAERNEAFRR